MEIDIEYIIAYLQGDLSAEERRSFELRLEESPILRKKIKDTRFVLGITDELKNRSNIKTSKNWGQLHWRMRLNKFRKQSGRMIRTAAAVLFIPLLIGGYLLFDTMRKWQDLSGEQIELTAAHGLISKIVLPDSSVVWLNSGTTISYPKQFSGFRRTVELSGEAYFQVTADRINRFDVKTPEGVIVSAYGTEFNVSAYKDDAQVEAVLVKGNIDFSEGEQAEAYTLTPGQQAIFTKDDNNVKIEKANILVKTAWKDGKMVFRRAMLPEVAKRLSRRFNADIRLESKELYSYEYNATFTNETLDEIIFLLEKTAPIKCWIIEPELTEDFSFSQRIVIIRGENDAKEMDKSAKKGGIVK